MTACNSIFFLVSCFLLLIGVLGILKNLNKKHYKVCAYRVGISGYLEYFSTYKEALAARQEYEKETYVEGEDGWGELPEPVYTKLGD